MKKITGLLIIGLLFSININAEVKVDKAAQSQEEMLKMVMGGQSKILKNMNEFKKCNIKAGTKKEKKEKCKKTLQNALHASMVDTQRDLNSKLQTDSVK